MTSCTNEGSIDADAGSGHLSIHTEGNGILPGTTGFCRCGELCVGTVRDGGLGL